MSLPPIEYTSYYMWPYRKKIKIKNRKNRKVHENKKIDSKSINYFCLLLQIYFIYLTLSYKY